VLGAARLINHPDSLTGHLELSDWHLVAIDDEELLALI
jgi:hypothetical protein